MERRDFYELRPGDPVKVEFTEISETDLTKEITTLSGEVIGISTDGGVRVLIHETDKDGKTKNIVRWVFWSAIVEVELKSPESAPVWIKNGKETQQPVFGTPSMREARLALRAVSFHLGLDKARRCLHAIGLDHIRYLTPGSAHELTALCDKVLHKHDDILGETVRMERDKEMRNK